MTAAAEYITEEFVEDSVFANGIVADRTTSYAQDVVDGKIVVGELVRLSCQRHLDDLVHGHERGLYFKVEAAEASINFFPNYLVFTKGRWGGQPFELQRWQQFVTGSIFGWKKLYGSCPTCGDWLDVNDLGFVDCVGCDPVGEMRVEPLETQYLRRFRTAYEEVARKNGKTEWVAGVMLRQLGFDDEYGPEVYTGATKAEQAKIPFNAAKKMAEMSPRLQAMFDVQTFSIADLDYNGILKYLSADASTQDGLNASTSVIEEFHAHKTRELVEVLDTSTAARLQPLMIFITTAGDNKATVCRKEHDDAVNILRGIFKDDSYFVYIAAMDKDDDWKDPKNWIKSNPSLGVSVSSQNLKNKLAKALNTPSKQGQFKQKHLNIWIQSVDAWIDVEKFQSLSINIPKEDLKGKALCFGYDAAEKVDFVAQVFLFPPDPSMGRKNPFYKSFFWLPEGALERRENKRVRDQIKNWADEGFITLIPGEVLDLDIIERDVLNNAAYYGAGVMLFDPYKATQMSVRAQKVNIDTIEFRQTPLSMSEPCGEFERMILNKEMLVDDNPVFAWMVGNMVKTTDSNGNIKADRKKSSEKIDGGIAAIMATGEYMLPSNKPKKIIPKGYVSPMDRD